MTTDQSLVIFEGDAALSKKAIEVRPADIFGCHQEK